MDEWFVVLFWSGPIGLGAFFAGLGVFFWGLSKERKSKDDRRAGQSEARD